MSMSLLTRGWPSRFAAGFPAAGVHLQVGVFLQLAELDEGGSIDEGEALLRAAIGAAFPGGDDEGLELFAGGAPAKGTAQGGAGLRVKAEVPHPVGGEARPAAGAAEGGGGGRDDAEDRAIGEGEAVRRGG